MFRHRVERRGKEKTSEEMENKIFSQMGEEIKEITKSESAELIRM